MSENNTPWSYGWQCPFGAIRCHRRTNTTTRTSISVGPNAASRLRIGWSLGPERANLIPTLGVPDDRGLRIGNAGNTHAPTRPGVCSFLRARRASEFGIAKPATYCARFFHTAENEKQLRARDVPTLPCSIGLLSRKLRHSVRNWIVSAASKKTRQFNFIAFSLARISRKPCSVATTRCSAKY